MPKDLEPNIKGNFEFDGGLYFTNPELYPLAIDRINKKINQERKIRDHSPLAGDDFITLARNCEKIIKDHLDVDIVFNHQITCYNAPASYHFDKDKNILNAQITCRHNVTGGHVTIPDLDFTFEGADRSLLVFPAWKYLHGVTPIHGTGHRNSIIFYNKSNRYFST